MTPEKAKKIVYDIATKQMGKESERPIYAKLSIMTEFDSLDFVEMLMAIEDEIGVEVLDEVAGEFGTVKDVIDHIVKVA